MKPTRGGKGGKGGGRDGRRKGVRHTTKNVRLKEAVKRYCPQKIKFEWGDQGTMLQVGPNASWWNNVVGKLVREFPMHYPSWYLIEDAKKVHIRGRLMMQTDENHEYPSLISSFYDLHTHEGVWVQEDARLQYEEMIKLPDLGAYTPIGVPYVEERILSMFIKGKQRGHIPRRGRQVAGRGKTLIVGSQPRGTYSQLDIDDMLAEIDQALAAANTQVKAQRRELDELKSVLRSDPRMVELLSQLGSERTAVLLGADDLSSGKVFPSLTLFDQSKSFPDDMYSGKVSPV
ncbi:hypothetical protein Tco_1132290 [Tanacetum coccineum]|uniref:Uncharacterized protein n=1 Tax=Tanacetum coccineum TaxID=301880 RepID=A0ABQ5JBI0_9ASTR